ncbi:hypothetical protein DRP07_03165 [Archaeoglobales archaeon]|nr:MAG: hypothetical protein DRP07_03165 [Archaeoglobales archaeon]
MNANDERNAEKELGEQIKNMLKEQFGVERINLSFREMGKKRIYAYRDCELDFNVRKVSQGIYFGTIEKDGLRLSIEGSFLVGPKAKKNVVEVSRYRAERWMMGENLEMDQKDNLEAKDDKKDGKYVILKSGSYFLGCGRVKGDRIINFVPKNRRIL